MSSKPKVYSYPLSPPSRLVLCMLAIGNIPYESITLDLFKGEHKTEEYTKINPNQTVPALVEGDLVLWESHAIAKYLCDKVPFPLNSVTSSIRRNL